MFDSLSIGSTLQTPDSRLHMAPDSRLKIPYDSTTPRLQTQDFILLIFTHGRTAPAVLGLPQKETGIMSQGFSHALPVRHATLSAARPSMHTGPRLRFRFIAKPFAELKNQQTPTGGKPRTRDAMAATAATGVDATHTLNIALIHRCRLPNRAVNDARCRDARHRCS